MPELPEVEIQARNLTAWLVGRRIDKARVAATRIVRGSTAKAIERLLKGHRVEDVTRRGKWIRIGLDGGGALFSHLGMTGKWVLRAPDAPPTPHERARLDASDHSVRYDDPRMFGRLVPSPRGDAIPEWASLGPDPLVDGIDAQQLGKALASRRTAIKIALMDQSIIAGLGNIQVTEALWRTRIHPARRADSLDQRELERLVDAIRATLEDTLRKEAGPEITYVEEAGAPNPFAVYGRAGEPCPRCGATLQKDTIGGRTTVYCPREQRLDSINR